MKNVRKYIPKIILLDTLIFILVLGVIVFFFHLAGLTFRMWAWQVFLNLIFISGAVGIFQLIRKLNRKRLKIVLACLAAVAVLGASLLMFTGTILAMGTPEHVIERDGDMYLVRVFSWMDTDVTYYEYKNFLVQGRYPRLREYYGNGAVDPFDGEHNYPPKSTIYYDQNGNIIETITN